MHNIKIGAFIVSKHLSFSPTADYRNLNTAEFSISRELPPDVDITLFFVVSNGKDIHKFLPFGDGEFDSCIVKNSACTFFDHILFADNPCF